MAKPSLSPRIAATTSSALPSPCNRASPGRRPAGVGSIDVSGLCYTAGSVAGLATITATSRSVVAGSAASVTVTNAAPTALVTPAAAAPGSVTGTFTTLSASSVPTTAERGQPDLHLDGHRPSPPEPRPTRPTAAMEPTGPRTPPPHSTQAGSYTFLVTIADTGGLTASTSSVSVTVDQTLTAITDSPSSVSLNSQMAPDHSPRSATTSSRVASRRATELHLGHRQPASARSMPRASTPREVSPGRPRSRQLAGLWSAVQRSQ